MLAIIQREYIKYENGVILSFTIHLVFHGCPH